MNVLFAIALRDAARTALISSESSGRGTLIRSCGVSAGGWIVNRAKIETKKRIDVCVRLLLEQDDEFDH
jgi:hypothetical protein